MSIVLWEPPFQNVSKNELGGLINKTEFYYLTEKKIEISKGQIISQKLMQNRKDYSCNHMEHNN